MDDNTNTSHTVNNVLHMLDEHDCSLIATDLYERLEPNADEYDFLGKDECFALEYILSKISINHEFEKRKISKLKRMVGTLIMRGKISEIMSDVGNDLGCDFYFEDIGIDVDMDSFHTEISQFIVEASQDIAQALRTTTDKH